MSPSTSWPAPTKRAGLAWTAALALGLAAFLFGAGLGPDSLPFPPRSDFSDAVTSHWPSAVFLRDSVREDGTWPLWRPLIMSGSPFAANPLNKVWYPPQWLVLIVPPILHLNLLAWLHLVAGGAGAWLWSRGSGLGPWPATLTGAGYAFAPRIVAAVGAGHLDLVYAAAWFPWLLWAIDRLARPVPARGSVAGLGAIAALCFLADVRLSAYFFAFVAAYLAWRWRTTPGLTLRRHGTRTALAALLAAGLSAVQWIPLLLYRAGLSRADITLDEAALHSLSPGQWIGLLIGDHGGGWETMVYMGVSTLLLALAALALRPRALAFWGLALAAAMLYAMGDHSPLWVALNRLIPPLRWWRVPPRAWFIAALALPYLAGWGAQLLAERPPDRKAARLGIAGLLGGGLVCGIFSSLTLSSSLELTALLGTFALPAAALVLLLAMRRALPPRAIMALFALVVVGDMLWIDRTLVDGRPRDAWLDPHQELAEFLEADGAARVYSPSYSLPQQAAAHWSIAQFGGVDPFQLAAYVGAFEAATGVAAQGYSVTLPAYDLADAPGADEDGDSEAAIFARANREAPLDAALLGQWLVTHVVAAFPIEADGLAPAAQIGDVYVYRNTLAPDVTLAWDGPNRVTVRAAAPFDGTLYAVTKGRWQAVDADSPGLPGAVAAPAREWTYRYDASEVWIGLAAGGGLCAAALAGWWVVRHA